MADLAEETARQDIESAYWFLLSWYEKVWVERDEPQMVSFQVNLDARRRSGLAEFKDKVVSHPQPL